jgi:carbonic anhydrase/acetyltransferase-like protein (isoleucine patch superfamily)
VNRIVIGARTNIQDGTVVHCESPSEKHPDGFPTLIGEDVLIGHLAMVHGCVLEDRAFVGLSAIVMDGARIGRDAMLAAGAQLTSGKAILPGQLWVGRPAKYLRDLPESAKVEMRRGVAHYVENARAHKAAQEAKVDGAAKV